MTCRHVIGPWVLSEWTKPSGKLVKRWMPPAGGTGRIDLRPLAARALSTPEGIGFFCLDPSDSAPEGYLDLGMDMGARLSAKVAGEWESMLDLSSGDLDAPTLADALWWLWTAYGDERVRNFAGAVNTKGMVSLGLEGHGYIKREKFSKTNHPAVLKALRQNYVTTVTRRAEALALLMRKTGLAATELSVPSGGANVSDAFTESSTISLDAHTPDAVTGKTAGTSWDELRGNWSNNSAGYATMDTNTSNPPGSARLNPALSGDDMTVTFTILTVNDFKAAGICGRFSATVNSWLGYLRDVENSGSHELMEVVEGGTPTSLATLANDYPDPATPYDRVLTIDGSDMEGFEDGVSKVTYASAGLTGNNHCGLIAEDAVSTGGAHMDDFYGDDIGGAPAPVRVLRSLGLLGVGR